MKKLIIAFIFLGFAAAISSCASHRPGCPGMADYSPSMGKRAAVWK